MDNANTTNETTQAQGKTENGIHGTGTNKLFRKKSLDKISSPEQVTDYIRVQNRGTFLFLIAMIVLLAGALVWGFFGEVGGVAPITYIF